MSGHSRPIITFLSDFGTADGYAGSVKGVLKQKAPQAEIIDISHNLPVFNIPAAAFALLNYYKQYPPGTVHLVVVDPGVGSKRPAIIVRSKEHYFVGPDNGVFRYILQQEACRKYRILPAGTGSGPVSPTFHGRDIFAPAAALLANGSDILEIAEEIQSEAETDDSASGFITYHQNRLEIPVLAIDHFGNMITALRKTAFSAYQKRFRYIEVNKQRITEISAFYAQQAPGGLLALWGSLDFLEIAVNQGSAAEQLQFDLNRDKVYIYLSET